MIHNPGNQRQPTNNSRLRKLSGAHLQGGMGILAGWFMAVPLAHYATINAHIHLVSPHVKIGHWDVFLGTSHTYESISRGVRCWICFILSPPPSVLEKPKRRGRYKWWRSRVLFFIVFDLSKNK